MIGSPRLSSRLLVVTIAALTSFGVLWLSACGGHHNDDAAATLTRLSKQGESLTYYARYEAADASNETPGSFITIYNKPGIGLRFDLGAPLHGDDATSEDDVLSGGDILVVNRALPQPFVSCRTTRQSCRTADGLERLAIVTFSALFRYDQPVFDQPHTVSAGGDISAAGETAKCFVITRRMGSSSEQATAERSGFVPGADLPETFCYAPDGLPLGGLVSATQPNTWIKAVEVKRDVGDAVFEPPFPLVHSVYDDTPEAGP